MLKVRKNYFILFILLYFAIFIKVYSSNIPKTIKLKSPVKTNEAKLIIDPEFEKIDSRWGSFASRSYTYIPIDSNKLESIYIYGMGKGTVLETWVDKPLGFIPEGCKKYFLLFISSNHKENAEMKDGGLIIDYGVFKSDIVPWGIKSRLIVMLKNVIPLVKKGDKIDERKKIAKFASIERYGYDPILTIFMMEMDENLTGACPTTIRLPE